MLKIKAEIKQKVPWSVFESSQRFFYNHLKMTEPLNIERIFFFFFFFVLTFSIKRPDKNRLYHLCHFGFIPTYLLLIAFSSF